MKYISSHKTRWKGVIDGESSGHSKALKRERGGFAVTLATYNFVILSVALVACVYNFRTNGIFSCQANGYKSDQYLAYCNASGYGEYEHGAFWFGLEPSSVNFATSAQIVFLGNSRLQYAFS